MFVRSHWFDARHCLSNRYRCGIEHLSFKSIQVLTNIDTLIRFFNEQLQTSIFASRKAAVVWRVRTEASLTGRAGFIRANGTMQGMQVVHFNLQLAEPFARQIMHGLLRF